MPLEVRSTVRSCRQISAPSELKWTSHSRLTATPEAALQAMRDRGWSLVALRDGWYADDGEGGVAVWGQGAYWEVRDTPFSVSRH